VGDVKDRAFWIPFLLALGAFIIVAAMRIDYVMNPTRAEPKALPSWTTDWRLPR